MKPSEILQEFYDANLQRYAGFDPDTKQIASLANMVMKIGEILDQHQFILEGIIKGQEVSPQVAEAEGQKD